MVRLRYTARLAQSTWSLAKISQHRILIISSEKGFDTLWGKGELAVIGADTLLDISMLLFLVNAGLSDKFCWGKKKNLTRVLLAFMS
ncbi:hypothetical protein BBM30_05640 [Vibrio parahaemolyticus]|nr:hypothetical protein M636_17310 [Vibrio parahaemolyticus O1:K33 str. CDC_K4557]ODY85173.1 hypothetical protein BBM30_05640 [Vibrio parahaemolyticus]